MGMVIPKEEKGWTKEKQQETNRNSAVKDRFWLCGNVFFLFIFFFFAPILFFGAIMRTCFVLIPFNSFLILFD